MRTALIILAALVVLIVAVVMLGRRYLRADDGDDFDDVRGRSGRDLGHSPRERGHSGDRDMPFARSGQARGGQSRADDRGWRGEGDRRQRADDGRDARGWRADEGQRGQRTLHAARDGRPAGRMERGDDGEFSGAGGRTDRRLADRGGQRGPRDHDDGPAFDSTQDYAGRDRREARADRARSGAAVGHDAGREDRADRGNARPSTRPDGRRASGQGKREPLPAVRSRQGRSKREGDGDWPSTEWDELSDVDYWAELASDKPLTTTSQPDQPARPDRQEPRRLAGIGTGRHDRSGTGPERSPSAKLPARLPSRSRRPEPDGPAMPTGRGQSGSSGRTDEFSGVGGRRPSAASSEPITAMLTGRAADDRGPGSQVADDDPLTSPSFPRIGGDDSRSYHRSRAEEPSAQDGGLTPPSGYPRPSRGEPEYAQPSLDPYQSVPSSSSAPQGYPIPATAGTGGYPLPSPTPIARGAETYQPPVPARTPPVSTGPAGIGPDNTGSYSSLPAAALPAGGYPAQATAGFAGPASPGYQSDHAQAGYQGYQGATAAYPMPAGQPGYLGGQARGDQERDYQGYGSGPHPPPADAVYPPLPEPGPAHAASQAGPVALGQQATSYSGYPTPGFTGDVGGYRAPVAALPAPQVAGAQQMPPLPGMQSASYGTFPAGPTSAPDQATQYYSVPNYAEPSEPAGYPSAGQEPGGYAGSDPYAVDPYGYPGYGAGGY